MNTVTAVLAGAGDRGADSYGRYAQLNPQKLRFVGVAEPNPARRAAFSHGHLIADSAQFDTWDDLLAAPQLADWAIIATQDRMHFEPARRALEKGYRVLLEKPLSTSIGECIELADCSRRYPNQLLVCLVLRYAPFYTAIRGLIDGGRIGQLVSMQHTENVPLVDQTHAFVRGNWRASAESCPMILAHGCHDLDLLRWFAGSPCAAISSFGSVLHFKAESALPGTPDRCTDGCPHEESCPHSALKIYAHGDEGWPASVISDGSSPGARLEALEHGPYGRCVYRCDNDAVDHQVTAIEFENGVTATFTMSAFNRDAGRTTKIMGSRGEIRAAQGRNEIEVYELGTGRTDVIRPPAGRHRYGGADFGLMDYIYQLTTSEATDPGLTSAQSALECHLMAFAAEQSRLSGSTVKLDRSFRSR